MTRESLGDLLTGHRPLRFLQAHDGLSALIAQRASAELPGGPVKFDGIWLSSFADATVRGLPDDGRLAVDRRLATATDVLSLMNIPVLFDGENGGEVQEVCRLVRSLEQVGVSGVVLEDKVGPKFNSLLPNVVHHLDTPERFAAKLEAAREARQSTGFKVVARIESLIAGARIEEALSRAMLYVEAGADGILIHSKEELPVDLFRFASEFSSLRSSRTSPFLACVPTTYSQITDTELHERGFDVVIHGNQLIRAAYSAMIAAANSVLVHDRSLEADSRTATVQEISQQLAANEAPAEPLRGAAP